jgi:hypothetical protein
MNVRRGLFRLWIVGSIVWVGGWLWAYPWPIQEEFLCMLGLSDNRFCNMRDPYSIYLPIAFLGPVIALAAWFAVGWIVSGFRARQKSN